MKSIYIQYVILFGVIYMCFSTLFTFNEQGISKKEQELQIKLHDLEQENSLLIKKNNQYEVKIILFKDELLKNDSSIDNSTNDQIDSLFTEYFAR